MNNDTALSPGQFDNATPLATSQTPSTINPVSTNSNIDANSLNTNGTNPLSVPTTTSNTNSFVTGLDTGVASANTNYTNTLTKGSTDLGIPSVDTLNQNVTNAKAPVDQTTSQINDLLNQLGYKAQDTSNLQSQYDIAGKTQAISDLNTQYAQTKANYDKLYQTTGGQNIPTGFVTGQLAIERSAAATQLGGIAAQIQVAQGNLNTANQTIENTIKNKYDTLQEQIDNKIKFYDINKANLTSAQQKLADRQTAILEAQKQNVVNEQSFATQAQKDLQTAISSMTVDPTVGYKAISDYLNKKISLGDFYKAIGVQNSSVNNSNDNAVVQQTLQLIGATQDMPVSQAITQLGMNKIVAGIIGQEGSSPKGVVNNPGNIKFVGQAGATDSGVKAQDGGTFASFPTLDAGQKAVANLVQKAADSGKNLSDFIASYKGVSNTGSTTISPQYKDVLEGKTPEQISAFNSLSEINKSNVSQLLSGKALLSDLMSSRGVTGSAARQKLLELAQKVDPTFSENTNKIRYNYNKDWSDATTNIGKTKVSINTALNHLADVSEYSKALTPSDLQIINKTKNWWNAETGNTAITNLQFGLTQLASEIATVYKGGTAPSDEEVNAQKAVLGTQFSKNQLEGIYDTAAQFLSGKISSLNYNYKSTMGTNPTQPVIDPDTRQNLINSGIDANKISADPNQKTIKINGVDAQVGQIYTNAQGKQGRLNADGTITPL